MKRIRSEEGGVAALVAIFVSAGIFLTAIALSVDSGVLYLERRVVDNAAQAAALALARECAQNTTTCPTSRVPQEISNRNSPDSATRITELCVNGKTALGNPCQSSTGTSIDCGAVPSSVKQYARIRTETQNPDQSAGTSTFFSNGKVLTLIGCAQAQWGNATSASSFSIFAVSICEWARQQSGLRVIAEFNTNTGTSDCTYTFTDYAGQTFTRSGINGWGALDLLSASLPADARASAQCPNPAVDRPAYLRIGYTLNQITRDQSSSNYCGNSNLSSKIGVWLNQTLYIPLVSTQKLQGNATVHTVEAFAAFKFLGYSLLKGSGSSSDIGGTYPSGNWCPKNTNCIYGEFIRTISPGSEVGNNGGPQLGLQAIELF